MAKDKLVTLGDELETLMEKIDEVKTMLKPLEEEEEKIRAEMCGGLLKKGLKYVRTTSGLSFGLVDGRTSFKVKTGFEEKAIDWAQKNFPSLLTFSSAKLNQVLKPMLNPPDFFEKKEGEPHLAVRTQD